MPHEIWMAAPECQEPPTYELHPSEDGLAQLPWANTRTNPVREERMKGRRERERQRCPVGPAYKREGEADTRASIVEYEKRTRERMRGDG